MEISTHSAQITVGDREATSGANINQRCSGYVADLHLWGNANFVAVRAGDPTIHILIAPDEKWRDDIEAEGFHILGKLSDIANVEISHAEKKT